MSTNSNLEAYCKFFENLNKDSLYENYNYFFDEKSIFQDPFQKVVGVDKIYEVFQDMYETLYEPKFIILDMSSSNKQSYIYWKFTYKTKKDSKTQFFDGISIVKFNENSKVEFHIDYWDATSNIYENIPILGAILRFIKKR